MACLGLSAEVAESTVEGLEKGERSYGYLLIAAIWLVSVRVGERGFYDGSRAIA